MSEYDILLSSDAMRRADAIVSAYQERLYDGAFARAARDGTKLVSVADVDAVAAEIDNMQLTQEELTAIYVARAALVLKDRGACEQEIAALTHLLERYEEQHNE